MNYRISTLQKENISEASRLDKKWFGQYGISEEELEVYIEQNPLNTLAVIDENKLLGLATFEILENEMPKDYIGNLDYEGKIMFIQQFTTKTNYEIEDMGIDTVLLDALEKKASELGCNEIWEALAIDHPYKKENRPDFDAFGFYESNGYEADKNRALLWQPSDEISIPCYVFRKIELSS